MSWQTPARGPLLPSRGLALMHSVALPLRLGLPLPQQVADGGVLCGQRVGEERHEAPEALSQLLHVLLQAVHVCVQLSPAALHLRQHVVHQALHLQRSPQRVELRLYMLGKHRVAGLHSERVIQDLC